MYCPECGGECVMAWRCEDGGATYRSVLDADMPAEGLR